MIFDEPTSKPLWVERADLHHGSDLTPVELVLEELDSSPNGWPVASSPSSVAGQPPDSVQGRRSRG